LTTLSAEALMVEFRVEPALAAVAGPYPCQQTAFAQTNDAKDHLGGTRACARRPHENPPGFGEGLVLARILHMKRFHKRIVLSGDNATAYVNQVQAGFGSNLPDGMKRIADAMARAERSMERR